MKEGKKLGRKTKAAILTMFISICNSLSTTIFNLIYNNYLIRIYGSHVNGLISTLTQFVSLFAIIEGGFTTAAIVATYKPIVEKDYNQLNDILFTAKKTYNRIGIMITAGVFVCGTVYIRFIDSPFSYLQTYSLLIVSVLTTASSLCLLSKYSILLQGNNKEYLSVCFTLTAKTITWIISMVLIVNNVHIVLVYAINLLNVLLNVGLVRAYEKKYFPYATYKGNYKGGLIKGTGDVFFQKIANTVFTSTDLVLISACISLASASVYNLYYQIFRAIYTLLSSVVQAPFNSFGQLAHQDKSGKFLAKYFNIYQNLVLLVSTVLLCTTGALIIPFVKVYTAEIVDIDYVNPVLALLFFSQLFAQVINRPYGTILNSTGNFKMQNKQCLASAVVNLIVSVAFIKQWGICSIILGSVVGTLIILVMNIFQAYKNVLHQNLLPTVKNILLNYCMGIAVIFICLEIDFAPGSYIKWVFLAIPTFIIIGIIVVLFNLLINNHGTMDVIKYAFATLQKKVKKQG